MLSLYDSQGPTRREFLRVGGLALGGLSLPAFLRAQEQGAQLVRDRAVVFVFMHGGPSQIETFDPKMSAPSGIASATGEIGTSLPGVTFGSTFPQLAQRLDRFNIVRSFQTGDGNHNVKPVVGQATEGANLGSYYSRVVGTNRADSGMPTNVVLFPQSVDDETMPAFKDLGDVTATGGIGSRYAPFAPSGGSDLKQNMELALPMSRFDDRRSLLTQLDRMRRELDGGRLTDQVDGLRRQAFDTLLGGVSGAFDLSQEDPTTIARYDTAPLVTPSSISTKWNNHKRYADNARSLGKLMLLARRLCERGCGFITVTTNFVWDMHSDANNAGVVEGMGYMGGPFDHAISAFLDDVHQRGLSEKILLVCCGEMGRTPKMNGRGGRDHWGNLAPLLISGGGLASGRVIGQSDRTASEPASDPVRIPNLIATILQRLLDVGELRLVRGMPREIIQAASIDPIPGLT